MGIDVHGLNLLRYAAARKSFGRTATMGRQGVHLPIEKLRKLLRLPEETDYGRYCEPLLKTHFGSTSVDSFDNSDYEQATHIVDMNEPVSMDAQYDTVLDLGTLEHIYKVPQALRNISQMCLPGGQILHMLPANNQCGHGFWQFSPELFFSLYSDANGYRETEVFLADLSNEDCWYRVTKPSGGRRAEVVSRSKLYVLVRTTIASRFCHRSIQQSDYVHVWQEGMLASQSAPFQSYVRLLKRTIGRLPIESHARLAYKQIKSFFPGNTGLCSRNVHLTRHRVSGLITNYSPAPSLNSRAHR